MGRDVPINHPEGENLAVMRTDIGLVSQLI
jgi:hypothetical protein